MLEFQRQICTDFISENALVILGKGLGLMHIVEEFLALYRDSRCFVLVLNCNAVQEEQLSRNGIRIVNNTVSTNERLGFYLSGGVFVITSRILVVDLLTSRVPAHLITGLLVLNAHNLNDSSNEAFAIKLYREQNADGFIKAISDCPEPFVGLSRLERSLKMLCLKNVHLWPRFHVAVTKDLSVDDSEDVARFELIELHQSLTKPMKKIQLCLIEIMKMLLSDLKSQPNLPIDPDFLTLENCMKKSFNKLINQCSSVSTRTNQLLADFRVVKRLLNALLQMDCVSFLNFLHNVVSSECIKNPRGTSSWLFTSEADLLFKCSQDRVFNIIDGHIKMVLEHIPKVELLLDILREICDQTVETEDVHTVLVVIDEKWSGRLLRNIVEKSVETLQGNPSESIQTAILQNLWHNYRTNNRQLAKLVNRVASNGETVEKKHFQAKRQRRTRGGASAVHDNQTRYSSAGEDINKLAGFFQIPTREDPPTSAQQEEIPDLPVVNNEFLEIGKSCRVKFNHQADFETLNNLKPRFIVLYDPSPQMVRQIEVYHALQKDTKLCVYFCVYEDSIEEQMYLENIKSENEAFESLIKTKSELTIHDIGNSSGAFIEKDQIVRSLLAENIAKELIPIIVDMREFRAQLPYALHLNNFKVIPQTIEVGDYLLTSKIVVERKSLPDLTDSLNSGRLLEQVKTMCSTYETPILMIETDRSLVKEDMNRLILLCMHFPKLRLLWASSPQRSTEMFRDLVPSSEVGKLPAVNTSNGLNEYKNPAPCDFLQKMPGMAISHEYVTRTYKTLAEFILEDDKDKMASTLGNAGKATKIYDFVRYSAI